MFVGPSRLSYLKKHLLEFDVNHTKDALRCENLIKMRGSEFFPIIENQFSDFFVKYMKIF